MQDIDNIVSDCINQINDKILGLNFLEQLKYPLIDKIKTCDLSKITIEIGKEYSIKNDNSNFIVKINQNIENISKIKKKTETDNLSIILDGLKTISIHDKSDAKIINQQFLTKYMGIVLSKDTIIDELVTKDTISLNIIVDHRYQNIDN